MERNSEEEPMDTLECDTAITAVAEGNNQTMQVEPPPPAQEENDRSEATFSYRVENFSKQRETLLSPPCIVRNLPWKIMLMPKFDNAQRPCTFGFFLQCNGESESTTWTCNAVAELRLISSKTSTSSYSRKIKHVFCSKENDWGFQSFIPYNDLFDRKQGLIENDTITLEVHVIAEAPHGVLWDSKKHTGYVGLKNQGATCYMNSLLQTLFFTNQLRKAVYKMPTEADDSNKSVALALQRVFNDLQFSHKPVGTKKLTKSFGWDTLDSFMQHDVQEFLRVLLDKLESKMKGTSLEGTIPKLFEGKMLSYIKCKNVQYTSKRTETFYDIQLSIKGMKNIYESFKDYIATETLEGDNKYDAGEYGMQEAEKGVVFLTFPPVLHLHLMRFQYDPVTDNSVKFNDRFEFYEEISLDEYLSEKESTDATYKLHAVLVHSGDNHGGHYVVYINPNADGKWCKFDDDVVSKCSKQEAIDHNYGGKDDEMSLNDKQNSNAYMLVYIRVSELDKVLETITAADLPTELSDRLTEEKRLETIKHTERPESNLYATVHVLLEECFEAHQTTGLFYLDDVRHRVFKIRKTLLVSDFIAILIDSFKVSKNRMRIWTIKLLNQIICPIYFNFLDEMDNPITEIAEYYNPWTILLEIAPADVPHSLPTFDKKRDILIFMKYYDAVRKQLNYIGFTQYPIQTKLIDIAIDINRRLRMPLDTELSVYHEYTNIQKLNNLNDTVERVLKIVREPTNAIFFIFEKKYHDEKLELPTCEGFILDQMCRIEVTFIDKNNPNDKGFTIELSQRNTYDQMAKAVAKRINSDPYEIQFFMCHSYRDLPGNPLHCHLDRTVEDFLAYSKPKGDKKIFYQKISMNISELENKKQFKCLWLSQNLKNEKELVLYLDKNSTVRDLLAEATKHVEFSDDSTRKLRLIEILSYKIYPGPDLDTSIEKLNCSYDISLSSHTDKKIYRIEEITQDELNLNDDEMLIPVSHFSKEIFSSFGIPFFMKVNNGETFGALKQRIQKKLNVPEKEWKMYKFVVIDMGRAEYIEDDVTKINIADFKPKSNDAGVPLPYFGLEHANKSQKRSHYNLLEKAIKIFN